MKITIEQYMTIDLLRVICERMVDEGKGLWPVTVAFKWKDDVVLSDIVSSVENGMTLQLNEEEFIDGRQKNRV